MIGKLTNNVTNNEGANAFPVVALQDTITALAAKGPARASIGRILSGVLSNPVSRAGKPDAPDAPDAPAGASGRRAAA